MQIKRVCVVPSISDKSEGGPASFHRILKRGLEIRDINISRGFDDSSSESVLVINGTRHLARLWRYKMRGVRIVQRLGGINWVHRFLPVGVRVYLLNEFRYLLARFIRSFVADHVVYQSNFVRDWWSRQCGTTKVSSNVIYNGTDLAQFNPQGSRYQSHADVCIISVEGNQGVDPFDIAVHHTCFLAETGLNVELLMFGRSWNNAQIRFAQYPFVNFMGSVPNSDLPYFYRGAAFYISTDIISAGCPNSVVEALACGTPVLGYKVGVLPELLNRSSGRCVEYNGNPWKREPPRNPEGMVSATFELLNGHDQYKDGARRMAEQQYGLDQMVNAYLEVLQGDTSA